MDMSQVFTPTPTATPQADTVQFGNTVVKQYPGMATKSPDVTAAVIQSGDPNTALAAAASTTFAPVAQAIQAHQANYNSQSLWASAIGDVTGVVKKVVSTVGKVPGISELMQWANKPLQEIQKDYKFIHSLYADHGIIDGMLGTIGVLAGGVAGAVFTENPLGIQAGIDLAAAGERNLFGRLVPAWHDSYVKSSDPNYNVSMGRDVANVVSKVPGFQSLADQQHGFGQTVSGAVDMFQDFNLDPIIGVGKVQAELKGGKFLAPATDAEGNIITQIVNGVERPKIVTTMPILNRFPGAVDAVKASSGVQLDSAGVLAAYQQGSAGFLGRIANTFNPLAASNASFARAMDKIGAETNFVKIMLPYPTITQDMAKELAKAPNGLEAARIIAQPLYAKELEDTTNAAAAGRLALPSMSSARSLVNGVRERIIQNADDPTYNETRNLLIPKKVAKTDAEGNVLLNPDGTSQRQWLGGGLYTKGENGTYQAYNALTGKIRSFTGYSGLNYSPTKLAQSGKEFDFSDPRAPAAIYNASYKSMPTNVLLEKVSQMFTETNPGRQAAQYATLVKETIKDAGVGANSDLFEKTMSMAQRSTMNGADRNAGGYAVDTNGGLLGTMRTKQGYDATGAPVGAPGDQLITSSLFGYQHGTNGMLDYKSLHAELKKANMYNRLYAATDDGYTHYIEKVFAPMVLFSGGFPVRVAAGEAIQEIMRNGLNAYLKNTIVGLGVRYKTSQMLEAKMKALTEATTPEDADALLSGKLVRTNAARKFINDKYELWDNLSAQGKRDAQSNAISSIHRNFRPAGYVSSKIGPYLAQDKFNEIAKQQEQYGNFTLPATASAGHFMRAANEADRAVNEFVGKVGVPSAPGQNNLSLFDTFDQNYHKNWALTASKLRNEQMAKDISNDYLRLTNSGLSSDEAWKQTTTNQAARIADPTKYVNERKVVLALDGAMPEDLADQQVRAIQGTVQGHDGTIHTNILQNISQGKSTFAKDLEQVPPASGPIRVMGHNDLPPVMSNILQQIMEVGHRSVIGPLIDYISRQQIFGELYYREIKALRPQVELGQLTEPEAIRFATQNAAGQITPLIHNPALRSQFAQAHRNTMPFFFAQEQALKRAGNLILRNPQAFREYQMIQQGMNNPGFVHTDSNGQKYIVYPMGGEFGNALARGLSALGLDQISGLPMSVTGSTSSLMSVLPEVKMAGVSPFASIALKEISKLFPDVSAVQQAENFATGGYPTPSMTDILLPNAGLRGIYQGLNFDQRESVVHNAIFSSIAAAYYHGDLGPEYLQMTPTEQQKVLDRIENNARSNLLIKGFLSFLAPLAPGVTNNYYNKDLQSFGSEFNNMIKSKAQGGLGLSFPEASLKFMQEHGSNAVSYTIAKTDSGAGGATLPLADSTLTWLKSNQDIMASHSFGAAYLVPQGATSTDALKVEQKLLAMNLRSQRTPQQFLDATYVAKGWSDIAPDLAAFEKAVKADQANGDKKSVSADIQAWATTTLDAGKSNPIWYASYMDTAKKLDAYKALSDLQTLQKVGRLGTTPQSQGISGLVDSYNSYHAQLAANTFNGRHTAQYSELKNQWYDYMQQLIGTNPELTNVINGVFKRVE